MASTVWRGYVSFGLISIPVRLYRAARPERVQFKRLYRPSNPGRAIQADEDDDSSDARENRSSLESLLPAGNNQSPVSARGTSAVGLGPALVRSNAAPLPLSEPLLSPVKQVSAQANSNEVVPEGSVVKGFEYEKGRFVAIEAEELKNAAPKTSTSMEIQEFVQLAEIDPVFFETSYYVTPEEAGEKAYALLYRSLQITGLVAIAQFAMHSREHVVVLRPGKRGLLAHTMFFVSEVRGEEEYIAETGAVSAKELELAQKLVHSLAAPFEPEKYRDTYRERLESIIEQKVQNRPVNAPAPMSRPAEVVDIADALRKSLANLKKPSASALHPSAGEEQLPGVEKQPAPPKGLTRTRKAKSG